jgi:hypothetical protein
MEIQEHAMQHHQLHVQVDVAHRREHVMMEQHHEVMDIMIVHCIVIAAQQVHIHYHHVHLIEVVVVVHHIQHHEKQLVQDER